MLLNFIVLAIAIGLFYLATQSLADTRLPCGGAYRMMGRRARGARGFRTDLFMLRVLGA